jgi:hypothetical protein
MSSMGASTIFASDVGSVSGATACLVEGCPLILEVDRRQFPQEFRRHSIWVVASHQQMEPILECKACPCYH